MKEFILNQPNSVYISALDKKFLYCEERFSTLKYFNGTPYYQKSSFKPLCYISAVRNIGTLFYLYILW